MAHEYIKLYPSCFIISIFLHIVDHVVNFLKSIIAGNNIHTANTLFHKEMGVLKVLLRTAVSRPLEPGRYKEEKESFGPVTLYTASAYSSSCIMSSG